MHLELLVRPQRCTAGGRLASVGADADASPNEITYTYLSTSAPLPHHPPLHNTTSHIPSFTDSGPISPVFPSIVRVVAVVRCYRLRISTAPNEVSRQSDRDINIVALYTYRATVV